MAYELYDVVIIGGGPAGLSAAQYAARAKLKTVVLDKSKTAGALAFASKIENYPGLTEPVSGNALLDIFRRQAEGFGAKYIETMVTGVTLEGETKEVYAMEGTYAGRTVIIATGSMGRKPSIKGEADFLGRGVSYCAVCDAAFFKGKTVCVLGDSEEAVKEAEYLARFAGKVYLIAPSKELKHPVPLHPNLEVITGKVATAIEGDEAVERVRLTDHEHRESSLEVSGVFVYLHGNKPIVDFLGETLERSEEECIITNRLMETSVPGVFAAGDVACTEVRQVVIAAANGCVAALSAEKYIRHLRRTRYDWAKTGQ